MILKNVVVIFCILIYLDLIDLFDAYLLIILKLYL